MIKNFCFLLKHLKNCLYISYDNYVIIKGHKNKMILYSKKMKITLIIDINNYE